jgi:hypothetical protein
MNKTNTPKNLRQIGRLEKKGIRWSEETFHQEQWMEFA